MGKDVKEKRGELAPVESWFPVLESWFPPRLLEWLRWPERWPEPAWSTGGWLRTEEVREDDALVVRVEAPGIDPDRDVEVTVRDGMLHIRVERREEERDTEGGRVRSEFRYGSFRRSLPLPAGASEADVKATYKDGIVEIRIPVSEPAATAQKIPVQRQS